MEIEKKDLKFSYHILDLFFHRYRLSVIGCHNLNYNTRKMFAPWRVVPPAQPWSMT